MDGRSGGDADVARDAPGGVDVQATIAAGLDPNPSPETEAIRVAPAFTPPCWHIERARLGASREVAVELVVNGVAADRTTIIADGAPRAVHFKTDIARSCWVALRILPSGHTHPIFVQVGGKPIRASKRSAQWCRTCVDTVWTLKSPFMRDSERAAAAQAFDHARKAYDAIGAECEVE